MCRIIRSEIEQEQCGFINETRTRNPIFMRRMISKLTIQIQMNIYLGFIVYAKAFDKV